MTGGAYAFPRKSAEGKTYLGSILLRLPKSCRATAYLYQDYRRNVPISEVLDPGRYDIVYLDGADHYCTEFLDAILDFARTGLVLLDLKNYVSGRGIGFASICCTDKSIEVEPCVFPA